MNPEIQGEGQVPLCDLGFGPLSCFVTLKPLSCEYLAPIKTVPREDAVHSVHNVDCELRTESAEAIERNVNNLEEPLPKGEPLPKASTATKLEAKSQQKKRTLPLPASPKGKKVVDDATSLQSFSSGGSSPSWSQKRNSPKGLGLPARALAGYKSDASRWT